MIVFGFISFWILFFIGVAVSIADFIRAILWQRQVKKQQVKADFMHVDMLEAWAKLEIALKNDLVATNSVKRWMRESIKQMDDAKEMTKTTHITINSENGKDIDLAKIKKEIDKHVDNFRA